MVGPASGSLTAPQRAATDPAVSAWVGASAGSGKTHVLTERILRLLLAGVPPHRILCLTYTRAAAAEMANRVGKKLALWATAGTSEIAEALGRAPDEGEIRRARGLFAQVVDAPEGLRIETIHGFCQSLLGRFPLEAGVAPHFRVIEERTADELLAEARLRVIARASTIASLGEALGVVSSHADDVGFADLMSELIGDRRRLDEFLKTGSLDDAKSKIWRYFDFAGPIDDAALVRRAAKAGAFDIGALGSAVTALAKGSGPDQERATKIGAWIKARESDRVSDFDKYAEIFLTEEGEPRKRLWTKAVEKADPAAPPALAAEADRVFEVMERRRASVVARATSALIELGAAVLDEYGAAKRRAAVLDFDDLIQAAKRLLERPGVAPWVLYKLDGIDHLLIDEAQDTSPEQWAILQALTSEFFVGRGAREVKRSVFAVGDPKQSIFSFQGADPAGFVSSRDRYQHLVRSGGETFIAVPLALSYRSTEAVLQAVDAVFATEAARAGVDPDGAEIRHSVKRVGMAGVVEIWPPVAPRDAVLPDAWALPLGADAGGEPEIDLAVAIAERIKGWIGREDLPARGRKIRPGDVMVLVRRRTRFVDVLVRRLKQLKVPVAGADRMTLTNQIAVRDVLSLVRFLLQPDDDLSLAEALRSPLLALDDDALEAVASERGGMTLWRAFQARMPDHPIVARLKSLLGRADFVAPYEFLCELLDAGGGRKLLAARLGEQANEPLDELVSLALDFERDHAPSLQRFVAWVETGGAEVKRNLEQGRDEVRILTVHSAKGLQAPIVVLPDTCQPPKDRHAVLWQDGLPIWTVNKEFRTAKIEQAIVARRERVMAEYRRLLYVAMTRAEDRLYVGGWLPKKKPPAGNWYELIAAALKGPLVGLQAGPPKTEDEAPGRVEAEAPDWALRSPPDEPVPPKPLAPSRQGDEPALRSPFDPRDEMRFRRGQLLHRLLETLPELDKATRAEAGRRFLDRVAKDLEARLRVELLGEALAVLAQPDAAPLFAPGSRAEVALSGVIGSRVVSGQVDRLALRGDVEVLIVDYKTNRDPPASVEATPVVYLAQLAAYRACLRAIYPGRRVRCFLLWTVGARLVEVPESSLDAHAPVA